jgi:hypothetical protein
MIKRVFFLALGLSVFSLAIVVTAGRFGPANHGGPIPGVDVLNILVGSIFLSFCVEGMRD